MNGTTRLVQDDAYEEMGSSYQCIQVATLDAALREHGVVNADIRRKVCETFLFEMGHFHDEGWLKTAPDAAPVYPLLCFSRRSVKRDRSVEELGDVFVPSALFSFHEYASGNAALLYEADPHAFVDTGTTAAEDT